MTTPSRELEIEAQILERQLHKIIEDGEQSVTVTENGFQNAIRTVAPQLKFDDVECVRQLTRGPGTTIYGPALYVLGAYHAYRVTSTYISSTTRAYHIRWTHCGRVTASYMNGRPCGVVTWGPAVVREQNEPKTMAAIEAALEYAGANFSVTLEWDRIWTPIGFRLIDMCGQVCHTVRLGYTSAKDAFLSDTAEDFDLPLVAYLEQDVWGRMTAVHWVEHSPPRHKYWLYNCAACGGGVSNDGCHCCGATQPGMHRVVSPLWKVPCPLPEVAYRSVSFTHKWKQSPQIALQQEYQRWINGVTSVYHSPAQVPVTQRAITLRAKGK